MTERRSTMTAAKRTRLKCVQDAARNRPEDADVHAQVARMFHPGMVVKSVVQHEGNVWYLLGEVESTDGVHLRVNLGPVPYTMPVTAVVAYRRKTRAERRRPGDAPSSIGTQDTP